MATYLITRVNPGGTEPSEELLKDLKAAVRGEARDRKAKVGRFSTDENSLAFDLTPDEAGEEIVSVLRADAGLDVIKVKSRFERLKVKYFTPAMKTEG